MARSFSKTLTLIGPFSTTLSSSSKPRPTQIVNFRHRSNLTERSPAIEIELEPNNNMAEFERMAMKKLEDAIHRIIVKRMEPDWLPFIPGASYWVPPKSKARGFAEVVGKLAGNSMTKDEALSVTSNRGWPSSAYFFKGASQYPLEGDTTSKYTPQSEDEEA